MQKTCLKSIMFPEKFAKTTAKLRVTQNLIIRKTKKNSS